MRELLPRLYLIVALLAVPTARADIVGETLDDPAFGQLTIERTTDAPKGVVLFASGKGGWNADLNAVAQEVAKLDYVVAGIDLDAYLARVDRSEAACVDASTDLDQLNRLMEQRYSPATHLPPILLGYGAGAALTYAALAQAPADRFHAGVAMDFCSELPLRKPLCPGAANLESATLPDNTGVLLKPVARLPTTWFVFQNRPACDSGTTAQFVKSISLARLAEIPGDDGIKSGLPQISALFQWLDPGIVKQVHPDVSVSGVPLTEVPSIGGPDRRRLAIMFSGDGGWALLDRTVTAELAKHGLPTAGWDSVSYFWKTRQPNEVALDLERVLRHYLTAWNKDRIVIIGFSFGADVLPATLNRLPKDLRDRIDLIALLGLSGYASFEFHLDDWISDEPDKGDQPVRPELEKLNGIKRLCIYGVEDENSVCPNLTGLGIIAEKMPGDHHFDEDYQGVARRILDQLPRPAISQPPAGN
jgi:type IV secretory pathway VirJ component